MYNTRYGRIDFTEDSPAIWWLDKLAFIAEHDSMERAMRMLNHLIFRCQIHCSNGQHYSHIEEP